MVGEALKALVDSGHMLASCPVTVAEVFAGMRDHEEATTTSLINRLRFYGFTPEIARSAGSIKCRWARKGRTVSLPDVLIAATAMHYGLRLITDNRKHFPMAELEIHELEETQPLPAPATP